MTTQSFLNVFPPQVNAFISGDQTLIDKNKVISPKQVHGDQIIVITDEYFKNGAHAIEADGLLTRVENLTLTVKTADCLSIFIFDPLSKGIGLIHAGWRGTRKKIAQKAIATMRIKWQTNASDVTIAFGPRIGPCCYQVGEEFKEYFPDDIIEKPDGLYLDLVKINKDQLIAAGVKAEHIHDKGNCTCCHNEYPSYRREGEKAKRMVSGIVIKRIKGLED